jgi:hypothetical protein
MSQAPYIRRFTTRATLLACNYRGAVASGETSRRTGSGIHPDKFAAYVFEGAGG